MIKFIRILSVVFLLLTAQSAMAAILQDLNTDEVTSYLTQDNLIQDQIQGKNFEEVYQGVELVPFPSSHDGYGVLDFGTDDFWVKSLILEEQTEFLSFTVWNNTPYVWSNYHIQFFNSGNEPVVINETVITQTVFLNHEWDPITQKLSFWAPDWVSPGDSFDFSFFITNATLRAPILMVQIPTTVPEPSTLLLLSIGILGLAKIGIKKR